MKLVYKELGSSFLFQTAEFYLKAGFSMKGYCRQPYKVTVIRALISVVLTKFPKLAGSVFFVSRIISYDLV